VGARRSQDRGEATTAEVRATGGRGKENGVNPDPGHPIYRGSTESAHCDSFRRTKRLNGSIPKNSRRDCAGFIANRLSNDLNSEFRSSGDSKLSSGHPDSKADSTSPHVTLI
jgi:hypothetical protein